MPPTDNAPTVEKALVAELEELTEQVAQQNSYSSTLVRGIVLGVGTAIGATLVVGILASVAWYVLDMFGLTQAFQPYLAPFMDRIGS
ncbi:MAG: hypothetical protein KBE09_04630 [Candidatus Pacebacteria bacterium]|nr:hypothetical protein [Candidatus Paceibacterota bacterium]